MIFVKHAACPITFGLLAILDSLSHFGINLDVFVAMSIVFGEIFQHLGKTCKYPSVATCPEIFASVVGGVAGVYIFGVAIEESSLLIVHDALCVFEVLV